MNAGEGGGRHRVLRVRNSAAVSAMSGQLETAKDEATDFPDS